MDSGTESSNAFVRKSRSAYSWGHREAIGTGSLTGLLKHDKNKSHTPIILICRNQSQNTLIFYGIRICCPLCVGMNNNLDGL